MSRADVDRQARGLEEGAARPGALGAWIVAARPRTLPAAIAPVLVGSACAARAGGFAPGVAALALAEALLIQIGTNFVNDWGDHRRGADGPGRIGPARAVQAGWISPRAMLAASALAFGAAALLGLALVARGGLPVLAIGIAAIAAGAAYTAGPWPLAYHGLGEAAAFAFFGPVAVCGTELVQLGRVTPLSLAASVPIGLLVAAILLVNNLRDADDDRRAGKRTLVVRVGRRRGRLLYLVLVAGAAAAPPALVAAGLAGPGALVALASAPLAVAPLGAVLRAREAASLDRALAATARLELVFAALLAAGIAR